MVTNVKIAIGCDHAGFELKEAITNHLSNNNVEYIDCGAYDEQSVDYPDFGVKLAMALKRDHAGRGIAICGSGIGISIALNRFSWVRAALVSKPEAAELARQHNDANVLALGERLISAETAEEAVQKFLSTEFEAGRHQRRVDKLSQIG